MVNIGDRVTTDDPDKRLCGKIGIVTEVISNGKVILDYENSQSWGIYLKKNLRVVT